jgi:hypothetical protein
MKKLVPIIIILVILAVLITSLVFTFKKDEYPRPTQYYYVNDFAGALLPGSCHSFLVEESAYIT